MRVAAAAGCDRAARSRRSRWRQSPFGSIAGFASGYRDVATSSIFRPCSMRVAAAAGCDRAARSRRSHRRWSPFGSIAASRGSAAATGNGDTLDIPAQLNACSRCRRLRSSGTLAAISSAPETLRVYRRLRQRLQGCGDILDIPAPLNACSRCRRLRSSGTLAAILPAPETLRVYRRLRQRLQRCCDPLGIPAPLKARVAAAAGCDRAARSRRSCRRRRPFGSIAASRGSGAATGNGDTLDIPLLLNACVAAAAGCDRAARSRRSCRRWRPFGSIAGCASGCRGERGGYRSPRPGRSQAITHIPICSRSVLKGTSPIWRRPALA